MYLCTHTDTNNNQRDVSFSLSAIGRCLIKNYQIKSYLLTYLECNQQFSFCDKIMPKNARNLFKISTLHLYGRQ